MSFTIKTGLKYQIVDLAQQNAIDKFNKEYGRELKRPNFLDSTSSDYHDIDFINYALTQLEKEGFELILMIEQSAGYYRILVKKPTPKGASEQCQ